MVWSRRNRTANTPASPRPPKAPHSRPSSARQPPRGALRRRLRDRHHPACPGTPRAGWATGAREVARLRVAPLPGLFRQLHLHRRGVDRAQQHDAVHQGGRSRPHAAQPDAAPVLLVPSLYHGDRGDPPVRVVPPFTHLTVTHTGLPAERAAPHRRDETQPRNRTGERRWPMAVAVLLTGMLSSSAPSPIPRKRRESPA